MDKQNHGETDVQRQRAWPVTEGKEIRAASQSEGITVTPSAKESNQGFIDWHFIARSLSPSPASHLLESLSHTEDPASWEFVRILLKK